MLAAFHSRKRQFARLLSPPLLPPLSPPLPPLKSLFAVACFTLSCRAVGRLTLSVSVREAGGRERPRYTRLFTADDRDDRDDRPRWTVLSVNLGAIATGGRFVITAEGDDGARLFIDDTEVVYSPCPNSGERRHDDTPLLNIYQVRYIDIGAVW